MKYETLTIDLDRILNSDNCPRKSLWNMSANLLPGSIEFIYNASKEFNIEIYSSKFKYIGGKYLVKRYLKKYMTDYLYTVHFDSLMDLELQEKEEPVEVTAYEVSQALKGIMRIISFTKNKPNGILTVGDRYIPFTGIWPDIEDIKHPKEEVGNEITNWNMESINNTVSKHLLNLSNKTHEELVSDLLELMAAIYPFHFALSYLIDKDADGVFIESSLFPNRSVEFDFKKEELPDDFAILEFSASYDIAFDMGCNIEIQNLKYLIKVLDKILDKKD